MGAIWAFFVCVHTVWLAKCSCLPVGGTNKRNDHGLQRMMEDSSSSELSLKKVIALFQSMESMLEQGAKAVQLETNDVEAESSVGHVKLAETLNRPKQLQTERAVPVGTAMDSGSVTFTFTFPAGSSAISNNGSHSAADDSGNSRNFFLGFFPSSGGISAGNGNGNTGISAGNGRGNSGISAGNGVGNGGISAGNGRGNSGISAGNGVGNGGISAGRGNGGISAGNGVGNGGISAGNGMGIGGIFTGRGNGGSNFFAGLGNFAGDSSCRICLRIYNPDMKLDRLPAINDTEKSNTEDADLHCSPYTMEEYVDSIKEL
ncbi:circumsporozoite protein-like [Acanthopagrus latus]|uniref:circumsporozoite protein-like n=1 Tax=Acanthopagrus latus TaxID=8177 RepID=UPI00187C37C3|nr:circumsporozoite protein-like [Acanthopagrus latus]